MQSVKVVVIIVFFHSHSSVIIGSSDNSVLLQEIDVEKYDESVFFFSYILRPIL